MLERVAMVVIVAVTVAINWDDIVDRAGRLRRWWADPVYRASAPACDPPGFAEAHRQLYDDLRSPEIGVRDIWPSRF